MTEHARFSLPDRQPAGRSDSIHRSATIAGVIRREEIRAGRQRASIPTQRRGSRFGQTAACDRLGEDVLVHVPQPLEVGGEEDVEIAGRDE
ncbi:unnamed protein product, partial [Mycena citricolor]